MTLPNKYCYECLRNKICDGYWIFRKKTQIYYKINWHSVPNDTYKNNKNNWTFKTNKEKVYVK